MAKGLKLKLDRTAKTSLAEQIRLGITAAIESRVLAPSARLPSWLALAAQLDSPASPYCCGYRMARAMA